MSESDSIVYCRAGLGIKFVCHLVCNRSAESSELWPTLPVRVAAGRLVVQCMWMCHLSYCSARACRRIGSNPPRRPAADERTAMGCDATRPQRRIQRPTSRLSSSSHQRQSSCTRHQGSCSMQSMDRSLVGSCNVLSRLLVRAIPARPADVCLQRQQRRAALHSTSNEPSGGSTWKTHMDAIRGEWDTRTAVHLHDLAMAATAMASRAAC